MWRTELEEKLKSNNAEKLKARNAKLEKLVKQLTSNFAGENNTSLILKKISELNNYEENSIPKYLLMGNINIALTENIF